MKIKKRFETLIALILIFTLFVTPLSAKAQGTINYFNVANTQTKITDEIRNEVKKTAEYLKRYYEKNGIELVDFRELILLQQSGIDCSNLVNQYIKKLKLKTVYDYAGAILILTLAGYDVTNFNNVNLIQGFEVNLSTYTEETMSDDSIVNPYYLQIIAYTVHAYKAQFTNPKKAIELINYTVASYYVNNGEGTAGFDYWGVSADNNGSILPALIPFSTYNNNINSIIANTFLWTSSQMESDGTILSWGIPSASSTGLALALFSVVGDDENAHKTYEGLLTFKSSNEGAYLHEGSDSIFSTKDVFRGLLAYLYYIEGKGNCFDVSGIVQRNLISNVKEKEKILETIKNNYNELKNAKILLNVNKKTLYLKTNQKAFNLVSTITGTKEKATFTSSNPKIASVDNISGKVVAKSTGSTVLSASVNEKSVFCLVTVKNPALTVKKTGITLRKNNSYTIKVATKPVAKIKYKSSNKSIAKVNSNGKIIAKRKGETVIIIKANNITKKFTVKVR